MSISAGDKLVLMPAATDPLGWVMASHRVTRARGLVPQAYVAPTTDGDDGLCGGSVKASSAIAGDAGCGAAFGNDSPSSVKAEQPAAGSAAHFPGPRASPTASSTKAIALRLPGSIERFMTSTQDPSMARLVVESAEGCSEGFDRSEARGVGSEAASRSAPDAPDDLPRSPPPPTGSPPLPSPPPSVWASSPVRSASSSSLCSPEALASALVRQQALESASWASSQQRPEDEAAGYVSSRPTADEWPLIEYHWVPLRASPVTQLRTAAATAHRVCVCVHGARQLTDDPPSCCAALRLR